MYSIMSRMIFASFSTAVKPPPDFCWQPRARKEAVQLQAENAYVREEINLKYNYSEIVGQGSAIR
jgi:hypothetical protein